MRVHFIAIGGAAMHNLAIALHNKGYQVTGSDDEIFNPSKSRLEAKGLLPMSYGWYEEKITKDIDAVILGMHAREDNPELLKAKELGLKIYSYPEYIYEQTKDKTRVVIGGSHGKTTITSIILHVLNFHNINHDYMVGAQLEGYDCMVGLSKDAPIVILEGDEYLSSPIDRRPKFHLYKPHLALLSGIAWDHINVFPTFDNYVEQFEIFIDSIEEGGSLAFYDGDIELNKLTQKKRVVEYLPYNTPKHTIDNGVTKLITDNEEIPLEVFGEHILQNIQGARLLLNKLDVTDEMFYKAIQSFKGASKRMELVKRTSNSVFYKDFAHSPSKLKATTNALKNQFPERELIACMELHTFSSLNKDFLGEYNGSMALADRAFVYFDPKVIAHKKLKEISKEEVKQAFNSENVEVYTDAEQLIKDLHQFNWNQRNLLMMSSGNFNGVNFNELAEELF